MGPPPIRKPPRTKTLEAREEIRRDEGHEEVGEETREKEALTRMARAHSKPPRTKTAKPAKRR
jgi:hypothetical protein